MMGKTAEGANVSPFGSEGKPKKTAIIVYQMRDTEE